MKVLVGLVATWMGWTVRWGLLWFVLEEEKREPAVAVEVGNDVDLHEKDAADGLQEEVMSILRVLLHWRRMKI